MTAEQDPQTSRLVGELVAHQTGFNALSRVDRQFVIKETKAAIVVMVDAIRTRPKKPRIRKVLRPVAPKPVESCPFKADDTFFSKSSGVKMVEHGLNFISWFASKVEEDVPDGLLVPLTLTQSANDSEVIADLGGEAVAEVTLSEIWRLMVAQSNGGEGALLNNGWANIFYVRDVNSVLRSVYVDWRDDGWGVRAGALGGIRWYGGRRVFSRNS